MLILKIIALITFGCTCILVGWLFKRPAITEAAESNWSKEELIAMDVEPSNLEED